MNPARTSLAHMSLARPRPASPRRAAGRRGPAPRLAIGALLAIAALQSGCSGGGEPAGEPERTFAEGVVLAIGDQELTDAELDAVARGVAILFPAEVERAHRRRALKTTLLPRLAVAAVHSDARAEALGQARERLAGLRAEPALAESVPVEIGNWKDLDLEVWSAAQDDLRAAGLDDFAVRELAPDELPGTWFGPVEYLGGFAVGRVESNRPGRAPLDLILQLTLQRYDYLPADFDIEDLRDAYGLHELVAVDPEVGDLVSGFYLEQLGQ